MNITGAIGRRSRLFTSLLTLVLFALATACRYLVPPQFSVAFVFLLPISFATWFISWVAGSVIALAGAVFLFYSDLHITRIGAVGAYWSSFINVVVAATFIYIFSELRALYSKQIDLSRRDSLTELLNRRAFMEMVAIENHRMARHHRALTIAYVDVDNFKRINDEYGHAEGDEFLIGLARHMSTRLRVTDYLARLGGDEFAILLPETDQAAARFVMSQIHESLLRFPTGRDYTATVSVGVVTFTSISSPDAMMAMADKAMYTIKQNGKNNIEYELAA